MKTSAKTFFLFLLFLFKDLLGQYGSSNYKEMFPNDVHLKKLLIVLPTPKKLTEIRSLLPYLDEFGVSYNYKKHIKGTEKTTMAIHKYIAKYKFNCDTVTLDSYNLEKYPTSQYPIIVYPETFIADPSYVTWGYRMIDVANNIKYGYVTGGYQPNVHKKYFQQLAFYIESLKKETSNDSKSLNSAEKTINQKQKTNRTLKTIGIVSIGVLGVLGILAIGPLTSTP